MRSTRDFLTGLLTGVAVGLLTAPRSGKETRKILSEEADKRTKDLQDQWSKGVDQVKQGYEQAKSKVNEGYEQAKSKVNDFASKNLPNSENNMDASKSQYNQTVEHMADNAHSGIDSTRDSIRVD